MAIPHDIETLKRRARASFYDGDHDLMSRLLDEAIAAALTAGDSAVIHRIAHTASDLFSRAGKKSRALELARLVVQHKRMEGSVDYELATYLVFLATVLGEMERVEEAVSYAEQGVRVYTSLGGEDHQETRMVRALLDRLKRESE